MDAACATHTNQHRSDTDTISELDTSADISTTSADTRTETAETCRQESQRSEGDEAACGLSRRESESESSHGIYVHSYQKGTADLLLNKLSASGSMAL